MKCFVIKYHGPSGNVQVAEFDEFEKATRTRHEWEQMVTDPDTEIVTIISDSLDSVRRSHRRYFLNELVAEEHLAEPQGQVSA